MSHLINQIKHVGGIVTTYKGRIDFVITLKQLQTLIKLLDK